MALFLAASGLAIAQNQPAPASDSASPADSGGSLADAARTTKTQKAAHAKKVFTDEDMEATAGPLPRLRMDGPENADDVVLAITKYKGSHTPDQTEQAVRIWYERYDDMLAAAIQDNLDVQTLRNANTSNGYDLCQASQDYQQCYNRQMAEQRGARNDQLHMANNSNLEVRIQHAFMKVRNGLMQNNLHYEWFKIRTTNGIDTFRIAVKLLRNPNLPQEIARRFAQDRDGALPFVVRP
ncbi:MAG TPA: hypothetical protein VMG31_10530 [Verrucomicrobiae bacterium]|nr:hypothetical protein [Verrucomicrobiae bacterium]